MKPVRGYIFSRPFLGERAPQHVQNLVIRDYCERHELHYLLSATEYAMPGSHLILDKVLAELPKLCGIVAYSLFQLPDDDVVRSKVVEKTLSCGKALYFAVEGFSIFDHESAARVELLWQIKKTVTRAPSGIHPEDANG